GRSGSMLLCFGRLRDGKNPARSAELMTDELVKLWASNAASSSDAARRADAAFMVRRNETWVDLASDLEDLGERAVMRAQLVHVPGDPTAISRALRSIGGRSSGRAQPFAYESPPRGRAGVAFLDPDGTSARLDSATGAFAPGAGLQLRVTPEV